MSEADFYFLFLRTQNCALKDFIMDLENSHIPDFTVHNNSQDR